MAKILVADDDSVIRRLLMHILKQDAHEAVMARDGAEAWELLQGDPVELAILDLAMPEMTGLDVLERVRGDARLHALPVVILTASGQESDEARAQSFRASLFMMKPFSSRELRANIASLIAS